MIKEALIIDQWKGDMRKKDHLYGQSLRDLRLVSRHSSAVLNFVQYSLWCRKFKVPEAALTGYVNDVLCPFPECIY